MVATATRAKRPTKTAAKRGPKKMSAAHKDALANGRRQSVAVGAYLSALVEAKPKRGRKRTRAAAEAQLAEVQEKIGAATGLRKLELAQRKIDLTRELEQMSNPTDMVGATRAGFVKHAAAYAEAKGITYAAWRAAGVPMADLKAAGIATTRTGGR